MQLQHQLPFIHSKKALPVPLKPLRPGEAPAGACGRSAPCAAAPASLRVMPRWERAPFHSGTRAGLGASASGTASSSSVLPESSESPRWGAPPRFGKRRRAGLQRGGSAAGRGEPALSHSGFAPCVVLGMCTFLFCFRAVGICQQYLFDCTNPQILQPASVV